MAQSLRLVLDTIEAAGGSGVALPELVEKTALGEQIVRRRLADLHSDGLIRAAKGRYLVKRTRAKPSKATDNQPAVTHRRAHRNSLRDRLWRALRLSRKATLAELLELLDEACTPNTHNHARRYLAALTRAGVTRHSRFKEGRARIWQLLTDLGPYAPLMRADGLYDPNGRRLIPYLMKGEVGDGT